VQAKSSADSHRGTKRKSDTDDNNDDTEEHFVDNYNPKYLTSRDLFDLELSDLAFQRHILVQALILIDFLLSLTERAKKKIEALASQKAMLYPFTLSETDTKWAQTTRATIKQSLQSTQDGRFYDRMVETVLARDKNWVRWKVESCPSIVRDAVPTEQELDARAAARRFTKPRNVPTRPQGAMDLSFLDEGQGSGLEALKNSARHGAPTIEDLLKGIENDKLDLDMAMGEEETTMYQNLIANKTWRALREARVSRLDLLEQLEPGKGLDAVFSAQKIGGTEGQEAPEDDAAAVPQIKMADVDDESVPVVTAMEVSQQGSVEAA
jgi:THO complex subunit 1